MKTFLFSTLIFIVGFLLSLSPANGASSGTFNGSLWSIEICDQCYSPSDFESAASHIMFGNVVVFNLSSREARSYQVNMGSGFGNPSFVPINTPLEALNAMEEYTHLKQALQSLTEPSAGSSGFSPLSSGGAPGWFGGICGPEGEDVAHYIPDGIFTKACGLHDECYRGGAQSKNFCDDLFKNALLDEINAHTEHLNIFLRELARLALKDAATIYHEAVVMLPQSYDAYCDSAANQNKEFCSIGWARAQWRLVAPGTNGGVSEGNVSFIVDNAFFIYSYRCVTTIVRDGGVSWIREQCFMERHLDRG